MNFIFDPGLTLYLPLYELDGSSFMSRDAYGHLCTTAGTSWRPNGRYFDGVDDLISVSSSLTVGTKPQTVVVWAYHNNAQNDGVAHSLIGASNAPTNNASLNIGKYADNKFYAGLYDSSGDERVKLNVGTFDEITQTWVMFTLINPASGASTLYFNDSLKGTGLGTPTAGIFTNLTIGDLAAWGSDAFDGIVGEVMIYNRALTLLEIQNKYLATKWRYK